MIPFEIKKEYSFTLQPNQFNDTAIVTFQSPRIEEVYCVVVRGYLKHGLAPFFDVLIKDPEIILTSMDYVANLWELVTKTSFKDRIEESYSFNYMAPKVFRYRLQHISER